MLDILPKIIWISSRMIESVISAAIDSALNYLKGIHGNTYATENPTVRNQKKEYPLLLSFLKKQHKTQSHHGDYL